MKFVLRVKTSWFCCIGSRVLQKLGRKKEKTCFVRGKWISFDRGAINKTYNLKELKDESKFKKVAKRTIIKQYSCKALKIP